MTTAWSLPVAKAASYRRGDLIHISCDYEESGPCGHSPDLRTIWNLVGDAGYDLMSFGICACIGDSLLNVVNFLSRCGN